VLLAEKNSEGVADLVALKTIRTKSADHETAPKQEANIATGLRHENIVKTYGHGGRPLQPAAAGVPAGVRQAVLRGRAGGTRFQKSARPGGRFGDARTTLRVAPEATTEQKLYMMVMDYIEGTDVRTFQNDHFKRELLSRCPRGLHREPHGPLRWLRAPLDHPPRHLAREPAASTRRAW
jgi:hypothetical protein